MILYALAYLSCLLCSATAFSSLLHREYPYAYLSRLWEQPSNGDGDFYVDDDGIREMATEFLGRPIHTNPFAQGPSRPDKSAVYKEEELNILWELHQDISALKDKSTGQSNPEFDAASIPSLHEVVLQMMGDTSDANSETPSDDSKTSENEWLDEVAKARIHQVRAIASDVDGTLLTSSMTVHPRTQEAIQKAIELSFSPLSTLQHFFPATGKSRAGALNSFRSTGSDMSQLLSQTPGVFLQGLYCVNAMGQCIFSRKLNTRAVEVAESLAKELNVSIVAYDGDLLWTTEVTDVVTELHEKYSEPMPQVLSTPISEYGPSVHKILLMHHDVERLATVVRPKLEALGEEYDATVTQAMPHIVEWLPRGCSKALGVQKLCEALGIDMSTQLLAIGDGENDKEMLQQASIGVAVGNAGEIAREAADYVMTETNDEGGAGAAMEVFAFGLY